MPQTAALLRFPVLCSFALLWAATTFAEEAKPSAAAPNLVANGDFSQAAGGKPDKWRADGDSSVEQTLSVAKDADGRPYAKLVCTRCEHTSPASHAMLAQMGGAQLVKGRMYEFSCRMRCEGMKGRTVSVSLPDTKVWQDSGLSAQFSLGPSWKTYSRIFRAKADVGPTGRLQIWFTEPGTLCVADVRISQVVEQEVEFTDVVPPVAGGKNLVPNGAFTLWASGWTSMGTGAGWGNLAWLHGTVEAGDTPRSKHFLRIPLGGDRTPVLYFDYYEPVVRRELRPLAAGKGWIKVEKGAAYTLSCDLRASRDATPALLGVRAAEPSGGQRDLQQTVTLTKEWKRYTFTFRPEQRYVFPFIGPNLTREEQVDVDVTAIQLEKGDSATDFEPRAAVEFAMESSRPGGIFVEGEPAALRLRACNHGSSPARVAVTFTVTDFEDKTAPLPGRTLEVAPGAAGTTMEFPLPREWKGYYRVRARAEAAGRTEKADVRIAIVPRRTADDSVLGINHAFAPAELIRLASKAGVTWYRDWSLKWQHVEPKRGEYKWEVADVQIDRVLREGRRVLPMLPPFPSADWASEAPAGLPTTGYPGVRLRQAWAPKDPADLAAFIEKAAARYKDRIHIWEFLNEPIYTDYSLPADRTNRYGGKKYAPADYVALLKVAAAAMRKADHSCKVIGGVGSGPTNMTRELIDAGILDCADILNLHMYPGLRSPESFIDGMDQLAALMDARGKRRPIWITEFSYYGADELPRKPFIPSPNSWAEERLFMTDSERRCAEYTLRYFLVMLSRGTQKIFIHSGASGQANQPNFECALFAAEGAPRKLFPALAVLTELLGPAPAFAGERRIGATGWAMAFETGKQSVVALWNADEDPASRISVTSTDRRCMDVMGRTLAAQPAGLSTSPVYLIGPAGKAKELLGSLH
jgi:hypothetical protein